MASGCISRVLLNCRSFSSRQIRLRRLVQGCEKDVGSLKVIMLGLHLYGSAGLCSPGKSMFVWPK